MKFIKSISTSTINVLKCILDTVRFQCQSNTGRNLRRIMKKMNISTVDDIKIEDIQSLTYVDVPITDKWKIVMASELMAAKNGELTIKQFSKEEVEKILENITT